MTGVPEGQGAGDLCGQGGAGGWGGLLLSNSVPNEPLRCYENSAFTDSPLS